jgi:hypothetical protein
MDDLNDILAAATRAIEPDYFRLRIDGGDPIYRERVYCYELYHQMRKRWPEGSPFFLNGEVDKRAHPILAQLGADGVTPDFLIHQPGNMEGNHAIIEVKSARAVAAGILKDLGILSLFRHRVRYARAIYLIYGDDVREGFLDRLQHIASDADELAPIEVWFHTRPLEPAACVGTLGA